MVSEARASEALKVEVDAQAFASQLAQVSRACTGRSVAILRGVRIDAALEGLTLSATDMEVFMRATMPATVEGPGGVVLAEAAKAAKVLKGLTGPLSLAYDEDDTHGALVVVSWTGATYRFPALTLEDFPVWPVLEDAGEIDRAAFVTVAERALSVVSSDESRPVLCGVRLELSGGTLTGVATDSYRLACDSAVDACTGRDIGVTLPGAGIAHVVKLTRAKGAAESIGWACSSESPAALHVGFTVGPIEVAMRRVEGQYPNWSTLRPEAYEVEHAIVGAELVAAAKRLGSFTGDRHPVLGLTVDAAGAVTLATRGGADGDARETLPTAATVAWSRKAAVPDEPLAAIGFNAAFLADAAASCGETVRLRLISPLRPAVFLNGRDEAWHLLMPVRLA